MCLSAYIGYLHWMTHQMIVLVRLTFHHFVFVIHVRMTHMCLLESNLIIYIGIGMLLSVICNMMLSDSESDLALLI